MGVKSSALATLARDDFPITPTAAAVGRVSLWQCGVPLHGDLRWYSIPQWRGN